jgi:hypothetical protein
LAVKCARVSVVMRMKSLKNCEMVSIVILAMALFLIWEKVVRAISDQIKFLPSMKHLSLFFFISSRKGGSKSAGEVESGEVMKKLDSKLTI